MPRPPGSVALDEKRDALPSSRPRCCGQAMADDGYRKLTYHGGRSTLTLRFRCEQCQRRGLLTEERQP